MHMKRKTSSIDTIKRRLATGLQRAWQRPAWPCFSHRPRRRTSTCSFSRLRPRRRAERAHRPRQHGELEHAVHNEMAALVDDDQTVCR